MLKSFQLNIPKKRKDENRSLSNLDMMRNDSAEQTCHSLKIAVTNLGFNTLGLTGSHKMKLTNLIYELLEYGTNSCLVIAIPKHPVMDQMMI